MPSGDFRRDVIRGFTDDGEVVNDGVDGFFVAFEGLEIHICDEALDFGDGVEDVMDAERPIPRRHRSLPAGCALSRLA